MIKNITVVGAGTMGHGIAHVFARKGYNVSIYEPFEAVREQAMEKISGELQFMVDEDYITAEEKEETLKHLKIYLRAYASSYTKDLNAYEGFQSPTILTYTKENNKWKLKDIWFPKDGSEYESSIRKAFPPNCVKEAMNLDGYDEEKHQAELEEVKALFDQA